MRDDLSHLEVRDPFDRFILATALQIAAPLVTTDRAIAATRVAEIIIS